MSFEKEIIELMKNRVINEIQDTSFIKIDYNHRKSIPDEYINKLWDSIDWNEVLESVKPEIQKRVCNSILGSMETEIKTDVKKILSVQGVRERIRMEIYPNIIKILDEEK